MCLIGFEPPTAGYLVFMTGATTGVPPRHGHKVHEHAYARPHRHLLLPRRSSPHDPGHQHEHAHSHEHENGHGHSHVWRHWRSYLLTHTKEAQQPVGYLHASG
jgi:pyridinium-3,5-bisthiocarboxylic acid mononucleotide nickel chelatase